MKQGLLHIRVEITLGKYQEQLLNLERKLESGLYCELTDKELKDSYVAVSYTHLDVYKRQIWIPLFLL